MKTLTILTGCAPIRRSSRSCLPDTVRDLCSQPTVSRWENAPNLRDLTRLVGVMIVLHCANYAKPPDAVMLDIGDTVDVVHGHQQLSLFNAHYDDRCLSTTCDEPAGRRASLSRQNSLRQRDPRSPPPPRLSHPPALATDPDHHPERAGLRGCLLAIVFVLRIRIAHRDACTNASPARGARRVATQEEAVDMDSNACRAGEVERKVWRDSNFFAARPASHNAAARCRPIRGVNPAKARQ
jgi:hypothetical protein